MNCMTQDQKQLSLKVVERDKTVYENIIVSVTSYNDKGKFDILPSHANFISLIKDKLEIIELGNLKKDIPLKDGVLKVEDNKVSVYLGVKF